MIDYTIVPMELKHVEAACALEARCFSRPTSEATLKSEVIKPEAVYFAAVIGDDLIGYVGMQTVLDEGYIMDLCVDPDHRRQGIARALMEMLTTAGTRLKLAFLTLEVRESNTPAISLYQSLSYQQVGLRKNYYEAPIENALLMTYYYPKEAKSC